MKHAAIHPLKNLGRFAHPVKRTAKVNPVRKTMPARVAKVANEIKKGTRR